MRFLLSCLLFAFSVSAIAAPEPAMTWEAQMADLKALRSEYVMKSPVFTPANRERASAYIDGLLARKAAMTAEEFLIACLTVSAYAQNGHDAVDIMGESWFPSRRLPFRLLWLADGIVVSRAGPAYDDLLGATVEKIGNLTPAQLQQELRRIGGGPDDYNVWNMNWVLEHRGMLHAMQLAESADKLTMTFTLPDGRRVVRDIAYVPSAEIPCCVIATRLWSAAPFAQESVMHFKAAAPVQNEPLYLQDAEAMYRSVTLPELDALYVQFRINMDFHGQKIEPFVERLMQQLRSAPPKNLVLDLRMDTGGNCDLTRELMRSIANRVRGHIYLLLGPQTFSAGIVSAAALKHDGGDRVVIVGAPVGDRLQWWSENHGSIVLPSSHYQLHINDGYWDLATGCAGQAHCYGDKYDARVVSLDPDIPAPLKVADWLAGRDPAMDAVRAHLQSAH